MKKPLLDAVSKRKQALVSARDSLQAACDRDEAGDCGVCNHEAVQAKKQLLIDLCSTRPPTTVQLYDYRYKRRIHNMDHG